MKSQKKSFFARILCSVLLVSSVSTAILPTLANAGGPQNVIVDMGLDFAKSIGGKILMSQLFPEKGVDYDRIRKDMEEVTRTVITDATITEALGRINGAGQNASTALHRTDAVDTLDSIRRQLVLDYSVTGVGMFRFAGLGNYIHGAQTELSTLAAMREQLALGKSGNCDVTCVTKILKDRLTYLIKYTTESRNEIMTKNTTDLMSKISGCWQKYSDTQCGTKGCWTTARYYVFTDGGAGYESPRYKDDNAACERFRTGSYIPSRKASVVKDQDNKLGWVADSVKAWQGALDILNK